MNTHSAAPADTRVLEILDEYLAERLAGRTPDREVILARHPELAESLEASFRALDFVHDAGRTLASSAEAPGREEPAALGRVLGDYRILREIARGGMAVVYEAEQVSLGRRVALKVLPFAAVLDSKQLQRFKNEAQAAAQIQHPHIVPVYAVGCDRGVHYYAMQYVEGQSLAVAIKELKEGGGGTGQKTPISSHGSNREPAFIRMAATLGVEAAQALDHAHQVGIVHRDVKPGNLLVDMAGTLWVTDFGLAHSHKDVGLTMTGELLGTIRYMSPEQALAKPAPVDHRTDVYSLGATLYELLALEPAFPGDDPVQLLKDIGSKEPTPLRRLNPALPSDVETVLLKAMSKDPAGRYATAAEMAEDLQRFLENRPIHAKRPGLVRRAAKWGRRHRTLVGAAAGVLLLAVAGLAIGSAVLWREQEQTQSASDRAESNLALALNALDVIYLVEAEGRGQIRPGLPRDLLQKGLGFYEKFATANQDNVRAARLMGRAHHRASLIHRELGEKDQASASLDRAIAYLRQVELQWPDDPVTHRTLGNALIDRGDMNGAIDEYAEAIRLQPDVAEAHVGLGNAYGGKGDLDRAIQKYRDAIGRKADLAAAYHNLGNALKAKHDLKGAIVEYRKAVGFAPASAAAHDHLGMALHESGDPDAAIAQFRLAIQVEPDYPNAHNSLGASLFQKGDWDGTIRECSEAVRLMPANHDAHYNLGMALHKKRDYDGATREFHEVLRLKPDDATLQFDVGDFLQSMRRFDEAIRAYTNAIQLKPGYAEAYAGLGMALGKSGDLEGALREAQKAIQFGPDLAEAHWCLGLTLRQQGNFVKALPSVRRGHELGSKRPDWGFPHSKEWVEDTERQAELELRLEQVLSGKSRPRDVVERVEFARILTLKSRHAEAARMYAEAFAEDAALAEDLDKGDRYNAACSASLAAARGGADSAEWRGKALEWLRADLAARKKVSSGLAPTLEHWKKDPDLSGIRDRIGDLPESEREGWRALWVAVDEALASAGQKPR